MRLMAGTVAGRGGVFALKGEAAVDLTAALPAIGADLGALIADEALMAAAALAADGAAAVPLAAVTPALPLASPPTIFCLGLNYIDHVREGGFETPSYPAIFMRGRNSIMAAGQPMIRPACSEQLDYEAELMVIIGRGGRHIPASAALAHVFGYTVFNDGSVRDFQMRSQQWTPGKNFDATGAIGPCVVTPDELPPGASGLRIESRIGGEILQSSTTANMLWSVAEAIATISQFATLQPGDHIAMGTPPGVGMARRPEPRWLRPGEVIEVEIEGIGICASPVVAEDPGAAG